MQLVSGNIPRTDGMSFIKREEVMLETHLKRETMRMW